MFFLCLRGSLRLPPTAQTCICGRGELATELRCKGWCLLALAVFVKPANGAHDPPFTYSQVWGVHWTHLQLRYKEAGHTSL